MLNWYFPNQSFPIWVTGHVDDRYVMLIGLLRTPFCTPERCVNIASFKCVPWHKKCRGSLLSQHMGRGKSRGRSRSKGTEVGIRTISCNVHKILKRGEPCSDLYFREFTLLQVCRLDWNALRLAEEQKVFFRRLLQ